MNILIKDTYKNVICEFLKGDWDIKILRYLRLSRLDLDYYADNLRISISTTSRFIYCCSV